MKYFLIAIIIVLLVSGCAQLAEQEPLEEAPEEVLTEEEILEQYPDDLDAAIEELDLIG